MKDRISDTRIKLLHPKVQDDFRRFVEEAEEGLNIVLRVAQGLRTFDEQQALYDQGRTKPGKIVTNAKPGSSYHNYGLAIDVVPLIENGTKLDWNFDYNKLLPYAKKYDLVWGGNFKSIVDKPHFEKTLGYNWRTLLKKHRERDFIPETKYVNI